MKDESERDTLNVLVLSGHRTEKLVGPLERTIDTAFTITHTTDSLLQRFFRTLFDGGRTIRREDIDVIVGDHGGVVGFAAVLLGCIFRRPALVRIGGEIWRINREKASERLEKREYRGYILIQIFRIMNWITFSFASGFLVLSNHLREMTIEETGCDPNAVRVIGVSIDMETYSAGSESAARSTLDIEATRVITTITNLRFHGKYEGVKAALPAVRSLIDDYDDLAYVVAGDGMYKNALERTIDNQFEQEIRDRVHLPGFVENVADLYAVSDIILYISFIDGFGNVVREAQAAGVPVVTNDARGMREQVEDGRTGVLIEPTEREIYEAVSDLLLDRVNRQRLTEEGRTAVATRGDPDRVGEELYRAIVDLST